MYTLLKKITWLLPHGQRLNTPRIGYEAIPLNPYLDSNPVGLALPCVWKSRRVTE